MASLNRFFLPRLTLEDSEDDQISNEDEAIVENQDADEEMGSRPITYEARELTDVSDTWALLCPHVDFVLSLCPLRFVYMSTLFLSVRPFCFDHMATFVLSVRPFCFVLMSTFVLSIHPFCFDHTATLSCLNIDFVLSIGSTSLVHASTLFSPDLNFVLSIQNFVLPHEKVRLLVQIIT